MFIAVSQILGTFDQFRVDGVTGTIRQGLALVAASEAYERLRALRGKVKFSIDLKELRQDRR